MFGTGGARDAWFEGPVVVGSCCARVRPHRVGHVKKRTRPCRVRYGDQSVEANCTTHNSSPMHLRTVQYGASSLARSWRPTARTCWIFAHDETPIVTRRTVYDSHTHRPTHTRPHIHTPTPTPVRLMAPRRAWGHTKVRSSECPRFLLAIPTAVPHFTKQLKSKL